MSIRGAIARNTLFNAMGRAWELAAGLFLTWYIVQRTGIEGLGLWSLVLAFTGYAALIDIGLNSGFARYVAEHHARNDREALSSVVVTGLAFYAALGVALAALTWPLIGIALDYAMNAGDTREMVRTLLRGGIVLFACNQLLGPFEAVPAGMQRMGITNAVGVATSLVKFAATIAFVEAGYGVIGLLYAQFVVLAAQAALDVCAAFYVAPGLRLSPSLLRRDTFRALYTFGWRAQVARLANVVNFQTDRAIIAFAFRDVALVGAFRLGEDLAGKLRQAPALLVTALLPAAADLDARDQRETLARLYVVSTKYMCAFAAPLCAFAIGAADSLMRAWQGAPQGVDTAANVLRVLALGYFANLIAGPGMSVALGMGRAEMSMYAGLISTAVNIMLTIALVVPLGLYGVALGTALGMVVSTVWFFLRMRALAGVPLRVLVRDAFMWPLAASIPILLIAAAANRAVAGQAGHFPHFIAVCIAAAASALVYLAAIRLTPFLDAFDVRFLERTLRLGRLPGFYFVFGGARHE